MKFGIIFLYLIVLILMVLSSLDIIVLPKYFNWFLGIVAVVAAFDIFLLSKKKLSKD